jgi:hypothetical protein
MTVWDELGGAGEEQPATAADVENLLVAAPAVKREKVVAVAEFAHLDIEEIQQALSEEKACDPVEALVGEGDGTKMNPVRLDCEKQGEQAEEEQVSQDRGCVDAVVGCWELRRFEGVGGHANSS